MAGTQIRFTVTAEAAAYLRWYARTILFEADENDAARHFMMKQLEATSRFYRKEEPGPEDLTPIPSSEPKTDGAS